MHLVTMHADFKVWRFAAWSRAVVGSALAAVAALSAVGWAAGESSWKATQANVRVVCPLTVGGSFEAKTRSLAGTVTLQTARPPSFSGALAVDLRTLDTGIGLRNTHMRENYLEVGRGQGYESAVLSEIRLADVDPETFEGTTAFTGSFVFHGVTKAISGQVEVRRSGPLVRLKAHFPINLPDFGIPKPRYLGVGVKDRVEVHVSFTAAPVPATGGGE